VLILDYFTTPKKNYRAFFMGLPNSFLPVPPPEVLRPGVSAMFSWALCASKGNTNLLFVILGERRTGFVFPFIF